MGTKTWAGGATGNWNVASNWSPSGVPATGDDVIINTSGCDVTLDVHIGGGQTNTGLNSLTITSGLLDTNDGSNRMLTIDEALDIGTAGNIDMNGSAVSIGTLAVGNGASASIIFSSATTTITLEPNSTHPVWGFGLGSAATVNFNGGTIKFAKVTSGTRYMQMGAEGVHVLNDVIVDTTYDIPWAGFFEAASLDIQDGNLNSYGGSTGITISGDLTVGNGTDAATLGYTSDSNGFHDQKFGSVVINANGTLNGSNQTTTITAGDFTHNTGGTFTHNDGEVVIASAGGDVGGSSTGTIFYKLEATSYVDLVKSITVENRLKVGGSSSFRFPNNITITMGTASVAGEIQTGSSTDKGLRFNTASRTIKFAAASQLKPWFATDSGAGWNIQAASVKVQLENGDFQYAFETDPNDRGFGGEYELTGDMEFDAVTVNTGDTLDINGQRVEFGGDVTYQGTIDADGLLVFRGGFTKYGTLNNAASGDIMTMSTSGFPTFSYITGYRSFFANGGVQLGTGGFTSIPTAIVASGELRTGTRNTSATNLTIATGGTFDASDNEHTVSGDFTTSGGLLGASCIKLDGGSPASKYVSCNGTVLNGATTFTIEAWIKPDVNNVSFMHIVDARDSGNDGVALSMLNQTIRLRIGDGSSDSLITDNVITETGKWYHVVGLRDSSNNTKIYVNGKLVKQGTSTRSISISTDLRIGALAYVAPNEGFDGCIDEVRIWNDERTQTEIRDNMFSEITSVGSDLILYAKFNEGTGNPVDSGTNTRTFTATGDVWTTSGTFTQGNSTVDLTGTGALTIQGDIDFNILKCAAATKTTTISRLSSGYININKNLYKGAGTLARNTSLSWRMSWKTGTGTVNNSGLSVSGASYPVDLSDTYVIYYHDATIAKEVKWEFFINGSHTTLAANQEATGYWNNAAYQTDVGDYNLKCAYMRFSDSASGKFTMGAGDLWMTNAGNGLQLTYPSNTFTAGPGATISGSSAGTNFKSQNNFEVVGKIENLDVTNEELKVTGQVINCNGDIHQYFPTIDHAQQLDADTADDRDITLGRDLDKNTELINS